TQNLGREAQGVLLNALAQADHRQVCRVRGLEPGELLPDVLRRYRAKAPVELVQFWHLRHGLERRRKLCTRQERSVLVLDGKLLCKLRPSCDQRDTLAGSREHHGNGCAPASGAENSDSFTHATS